MYRFPKLLVLCCTCCALDAWAQLWPAASNATSRASWTNWSGLVQTGVVKDARAAWCASALAERFAVLEDAATNAFRPRWYLWEHSNVTALKAGVESICVNYFHPGLNYDASSGCYTNAPVGFTPESLAAFAHAPTNFWTYTPWVALSSSANGWDGLHQVITSLVWLCRNDWRSVAYVRNPGWSGFYSSWEEAEAVAAAAYDSAAVETNTLDVWPVQEALLAAPYNARLYAAAGRLFFDRYASDLEFSAEAYLATNRWAVGVSTTGFGLVCSLGNATTSGVIGSIDRPAWPVPASDGAAQGYDLAGLWLVLRYNVPAGFRYQ